MRHWRTESYGQMKLHSNCLLLWVKPKFSHWRLQIIPWCLRLGRFSFYWFIRTLVFWWHCDRWKLPSHVAKFRHTSSWSRKRHINARRCPTSLLYCGSWVPWSNFPNLDRKKRHNRLASEITGPYAMRLCSMGHYESCLLYTSPSPRD